MPDAITAKRVAPKPAALAIVTTAFLACGWGKSAFEVGEGITDPALAEIAVRAGKATPVPPAAGAAVEAARPRGPRAPKALGRLAQ